MATNVGALDRLARIAIATGLLYGGLMVAVGSTLGTSLILLASLPAATAIFGTCPFYGWLRINTCQIQPPRRHPEAEAKQPRLSTPG